jgi:glutamate---cysteine ligase / carboxylate-amine ligase
MAPLDDKMARVSPRVSHAAERAGTLPLWARWNSSVEQRYTIGVEEELMLLGEAPAHAPSPASDEVIPQLSDELSARISPETHASVIELATGIHGGVSEATAELAALRAQLARELSELGLRAACAGTYPLARPDDIRTSGAGRYGTITSSMRMLARREPTLALHVHVGVPDPEDAVQLLNGLREVVPVLLALSANSPFNRGRDSGYASARTVIFQAFPRTGTARWFAGYGDYVEAVDVLIASGALPDPSFLWWDVRLQPTLGTVEVRAMDAQSSVADSAPLVALVQSLSMLVLEGEPAGPVTAPEVLAENRFLAARDGAQAQLINPTTRRLEPLRELAADLVERCRPCAAALGCAAQLEQIARLAAANGADLQRAWAREGGLPGLAAILAQRFTAAEPNDRGQPDDPAGPTSPLAGARFEGTSGAIRLPSNGTSVRRERTVEP